MEIEIGKRLVVVEVFTQARRHIGGGLVLGVIIVNRSLVVKLFA